MFEVLAKCPRKGEGGSHRALESPGLRVMPVLVSSEEVTRRDVLPRQRGGVRNGIIIGSAHCSPGMACVLSTPLNLYNKSMPVVKQVLFRPLYG